jgi:hypothetical protein
MNGGGVPAGTFGLAIAMSRGEQRVCMNLKNLLIYKG